MPACRSTSMSPPNSATAKCRFAKNGLALFVSQSGETADTLASLRYCKAQGQHIGAIVNVRESTIARESGTVFPTLAGPEIGVASTKAFTCQLAVLAALALAAGKARGHDRARRPRPHFVQALTEAPRLANQALKLEGADREDRAGPRQGSPRPLSRPRHQLSAGAGRRAEAQGNFLHPCRRLCRRRTEARADRADRREHAGRSSSRRTTRSSKRPSPTCRKCRRAAARSS